MENLQIQTTTPHGNMQTMNSFRFFSKLQIHPTKLSSFLRIPTSSSCTSPSLSLSLSLQNDPISVSEEEEHLRVRRVRGASKAAAVIATELKASWLDSLTSPLIPPLHKSHHSSSCDADGDGDPNWVLGIDPDLSGALALLRFRDSACSAEVFDTPCVKVMVGKRIRKRFDARSIVQLLQSFNAPIGTTAYIEQSMPYPKDGKQGWWSGGFGYGLWIGVLVASGFSVVPVPSFTWKNEFELSGGSCTKDDSRRIASTFFPSLSSSLKRKKDHGRAEALLIAAYGKGQKIKPTMASCVSEES